MARKWIKFQIQSVLYVLYARQKGCRHDFMRPLCSFGYLLSSCRNGSPAIPNVRSSLSASPIIASPILLRESLALRSLAGARPAENKHYRRFRLGITTPVAHGCRPRRPLNRRTPFHRGSISCHRGSGHGRRRVSTPALPRPPSPEPPAGGKGRRRRKEERRRKDRRRRGGSGRSPQRSCCCCLSPAAGKSRNDADRGCSAALCCSPMTALLRRWRAEKAAARRGRANMYSGGGVQERGPR